VTFDVRGYRATTCPPWAFTAQDGRTFVADYVSAPEVDRFIRKYDSTPPDSPERERAVHRLLRRAFPFRPSYFWRYRDDPVRQLYGLDPRTRAAALRDFFVQAGIQLIPAETPTIDPAPSEASADAPVASVT
jgi:hypothetical protein